MPLRGGFPAGGLPGALLPACRIEDAPCYPVRGYDFDVSRGRTPTLESLLRLADTAGLRDTADPVETIGVERAKKTIGGAEVLLLVLDASRPLEKEDEDLKRMAKSAELLPG